MKKNRALDIILVISFLILALVSGYALWLKDKPLPVIQSQPPGSH